MTLKYDFYHISDHHFELAAMEDEANLLAIETDHLDGQVYPPILL